MCVPDLECTPVPGEHICHKPLPPVPIGCVPPPWGTGAPCLYEDSAYGVAQFGVDWKVRTVRAEPGEELQQARLRRGGLAQDPSAPFFAIPARPSQLQRRLGLAVCRAAHKMRAARQRAAAAQPGGAPTRRIFSAAASPKQRHKQQGGARSKKKGQGQRPWLSLVKEHQ
jgi:hypothetical protein